MTIATTHTPKAIEAECALLGSMLLDPKVIGDVIQAIKNPADFFEQKHRVIYEVMTSLYDEAQGFDMVILKHRLEDMDILDQIGGVDYLVTLAESVPSAASAGYYAKLVRDKAVMRHLLDAAEGITRDVLDNTDPLPELVDKCERRIHAVSDGHVSNEAQGLSEILQDAYTQLESREGLGGVKTGYYELDDMLGGLKGGELIVIAARPSMGKSALGLCMAHHLAIFNDTPTLFVSLEMGRQMLAERLMALQSGVPMHKISRPDTLKHQEYEALADSIGKMKSNVLYIDEPSQLTVTQLRGRCRRLTEKLGLKALFVDYLQLMHGPKNENRQQEVSAISRDLKGLARELEIPIVALCQLNREVEGRTSHKPRMSDIRESGSIEQDADVVMLLHREDYYAKDQPDFTPDNTAELIVAKHRNGPTGTVKLVWAGGVMAFRNIQR